MAALNNRDSARIKHGQKEYKLNEVNIFNIFQEKTLYLHTCLFFVYRIQINKFKKRHTVRLFFIARYPLDTKKYNIQYLHKLRIAAIARNTTTSRVSFIYLFFAFLCFFLNVSSSFSSKIHNSTTIYYINGCSHADGISSKINGHSIHHFSDFSYIDPFLVIVYFIHVINYIKVQEEKIIKQFIQRDKN